MIENLVLLGPSPPPPDAKDDHVPRPCCQPYDTPPEGGRPWQWGARKPVGDAERTESVDVVAPDLLQLAACVERKGNERSRHEPSRDPEPGRPPTAPSESNGVLLGKESVPGAASDSGEGPHNRQREAVPILPVARVVSEKRSFVPDLGRDR